MYIVETLENAQGAWAEIEKELSTYFPTEDVKWRVGPTKQDKSQGIALAYIDARAVMDRLDSVLGPDGWEDQYRMTDKGAICSLTLRIYVKDFGIMTVTKEDIGSESDIESEKGATSDALKRAAVKFGVGRYLYSFPMQWVDLDEHKRIKKGAVKFPNWAIPTGGKAPVKKSDDELPARPYPKELMIEYLKEWASKQRRTASPDQRKFLGACVKNIFDGDEEKYKQVCKIVFNKEPENLTDAEVITMLNTWLNPVKNKEKAWVFSDIVKEEIFSLVM